MQNSSILAILMVSVIGVAGCTQSTGKPDFSILSPSEGQVVEGDVVITLSSSNFSIVEPKETNILGEGHFHFYLDSGQYISVAANTYEFKNLSPGQHIVRVEMKNNDHSDAGVVRIVSFIVAQKSANFSASAEATANKVTITLVPSNFQIVQPGQVNIEGQGHFHFYLDGGQYIPVANDTYMFENLAAGAHTLRIEMKNNDHSDRGISKTIEFVVPKGSGDYNAAALVSGRNATITLTTDGFRIISPNPTNVEGQGHFHFYLDGGPYIPVASSNYTFSNLSLGAHAVRIEQKENNQTDKGNTKTVSFSVPSFTPTLLLNRSNATITLGVSDFEIVEPGGMLESNKGHFHFYLDGGPYIPVATSSYSFTNLSEGNHRVRIELRNNDHSDGGIIRTLTFFVNITY